MKWQRRDEIDAEFVPGTDNSIPPSFYLLVGLAASYRALLAMARNYWQLVHPERMLLVIAVLVAVACVALKLLTKLGVRPTTALFTVLIATVALVGGGPIIRSLDAPLSWLVLLAVVVLSAFLSSRFSDSVVRTVSVVLVVTLGSGSLIGLYDTLTSMGEDNTVQSESDLADLAERPDIYLIVLDAYTGRQALLDLFEETKADLVGELAAHGFQLPKSVWTPYPATEMAIPSILNMSYPVDATDLNRSTRRALHAIISGGNDTVATLRANGYHTTMIESGWVGSSCGPEFDECISSVWLDEIMGYVLADSVFWQLAMNQAGHAFTANAIHTMDEVGELAMRPDPEGPRFVFAHVIAPHPPFFLDENCDLTVDSTRVFHSFSQAPADDARDALYLQQTQCVDLFISQFVDTVAEDAVVIFLGDHGIGRRLPPADGERPSDDAILEHQNAFLAVRTVNGCELTDPIVTSDVMRQVFSCFSVSPLEPVPQRVFLRGGYEMRPEEMVELMQSYD